MKVLVFVSTLNAGGVANVVLNQVKTCRRLDPSMTFEVATCDGVDSSNTEMFAKTYTITPFSVSPCSYFRDINRAIKLSGCNAVHVHMGHLCWIACMEAKKCGVDVRVAHSHSELPRSTSPLFRFAMKVAPFLNTRYSTKRFAVSEGAGIAYFGSKYDFLPNIIDVDRLVDLGDEARLAYSKEFGVNHDNTLILGFVGLLDKNKRPEFAIKVADALWEMGVDAVLLLVGTGPRFEEISELASRRDNVLMLGHRDDVIELLSFIDVLLAPSKIEGMSLSLLEAQLAGAACVVSDTIPPTNDIRLGGYVAADCNDIGKWVAHVSEIGRREDRCVGCVESRLNHLKEIGYDCETIGRKLLDAYAGN